MTAIHASGVLIDSSILLTDLDKIRQVFSPKASGIQNVQRVCEGFALQAEVAFSSFSAVLGSPGQCSYTAANAYMDAYVKACVVHDCMHENTDVWMHA